MTTQIAFFGSSKYAARVLDALIKAGYNVKLVLTQPDAPVGRDQVITPTAVAKYLEDRGLSLPPSVSHPPSIALIKPESLNHPDVIKTISDAKPILGVMLDYGLLIPKNIIDLFPRGIINLHPSLLPRHRGAIPAVSTILEGDAKTGVTVIKINEKYDQGEIIAQEEEPVLQDDTPPFLYDRLFRKGVTLLMQVLPEYLAGSITPKPQPKSDAPYEKRLTKGSGRIDWSQSDPDLERFIRAMTPWPGAWTTLPELRSHSRLLFSEISPPSSVLRPPTKTVKILKSHLDPKGRLQIDELQLEGKKPVTWQQFAAGYLKTK